MAESIFDHVEDQRQEAFIQGLLTYALSFPPFLKKFCEFMGWDSWEPVEVVPQYCEGNHRHDILIRFEGRRSKKIELKVDAPYTDAQSQDLLKHRREHHGPYQIDALILPKRRYSNNFRRKLVVRTWEDFENQLSSTGIGKLFHGIGDWTNWGVAVTIDEMRKDLLAFTSHDNLRQWYRLKWFFQNIAEKIDEKYDFNISKTFSRANRHYGIYITRKYYTRCWMLYIGFVWRRQGQGIGNIDLIIHEAYSTRAGRANIFKFDDDLTQWKNNCVPQKGTIIKLKDGQWKSDKVFRLMEKHLRIMKKQKEN